MFMLGRHAGGFIFKFETREPTGTFLRIVEPAAARRSLIHSREHKRSIILKPSSKEHDSKSHRRKF